MKNLQSNKNSVQGKDKKKIFRNEDYQKFKKVLSKWDDIVVQKIMNPTQRQCIDEIVQLSKEQLDYFKWSDQIAKQFAVTLQQQRHQKKDQQQSIFGQIQQGINNIFKKILIDELDDLMVKQIQKNSKSVAVFIANKERQESFCRLWKLCQNQFYRTIQNKQKIINENSKVIHV